MTSPTSDSSATTAVPGQFQFPREYFFPPFFTRQTNLTTHHAQLVKWSSLVLSYCAHHRIYKLSISSSGIYSSNSSTLPQQSDLDPDSQPNPNSQNSNKLELFHNPKINRQLSLSDIREVIDFLRKDNRAEYIYKSEQPPNGLVDSSYNHPAGGGDVVWIFWRTPEEWASMIEKWVDETGQKGSVLTLYELTYGEATRGTEFHGLDPELLQKALATLVKRGKAQIFGQEDSKGVKFF
ncbi:ESCRT-II complex subunit [Rhypophila decipiens]|uniref:ESCRT-II complex subunit VPS25 n=1 Tax=Rhypophila decipiens TaxID=261697 RepID=A0AAN7BE37_9PEZI|nr:ESCRT-II complex subunit [Rhypophila decipiens]